jgi:hypothetical protein
LRRLAYYSGGRVRGFLALIRSLAAMVYEEPVPDTSSDEMIDEVIDEARRRVEMGLHKGHIKLIKELMVDELHQDCPERPPKEEMPEAQINEETPLRLFVQDPLTQLLRRALLLATPQRPGPG